MTSERIDVAGERALSALARAHEKHGRERPKEEPKTIGLLSLDIFHTMQFCTVGSKYKIYKSSSGRIQ